MSFTHVNLHIYLSLVGDAMHFRTSAQSDKKDGVGAYRNVALSLPAGAGAGAAAGAAAATTITAIQGCHVRNRLLLVQRGRGRRRGMKGSA